MNKKYYRVVLEEVTADSPNEKEDTFFVGSETVEILGTWILQLKLHDGLWRFNNSLLESMKRSYERKNPVGLPL